MKGNLLNKIIVFVIILLFIITNQPACMSDTVEKYTTKPSLIEGLEAYWSFNNQAIPGNDDSGHGHHGIVNGATWTANGIKKGAMTFNGDDYISLPDFTSSESQGTFVAWVKQSLPLGQVGLIYTECNEFSDKPYIAFGFDGSKLFFARDVYGTSSNYQGKVDVGANDGEWHFIAFLSDGSENRFYFDGEEVFPNWQDDNVPEGIWFSSQPTDTNTIGVCNRPDHWGFYTGDIDEVRIYDRALTEEEIIELFQILEFTVQSGLGVKLNIKNNGTSDASNVEWQISVKGGIIGLIDFTEIGTIDSIAPGQSVKVGTRIFFGFGKIEITVKIGEATETVDGTQLFIFTKV